MRHSSLFLRTTLCLAMITATVCGCQKWSLRDLRGQGYSEATNSLTKNVRPPGDESRFTGLDAKARDIERNLGVR